MPGLYQSSAIVALAAMLVAGCRTDTATQAAADALPLATGDAQPIAYAPPVETLPAAPAVRYVPVAQPQQAYEYIDDAYEVNDAFGDSPPDYGFDYEGQRPWMWAAANAARVVEPYDGGERYYYYRNGSDDPYLVRDSSYSYAYSQGRLVNVYDSRGYVLDRIEAERRADGASRYYARARALRAAAARNHREQVIAANWAQRQARIDRDRNSWVREQQQIGQWRAYRARYSQEKAHRYAAEKQRRQREAIAFRDWRDRDYAGPAPRQEKARQNQAKLAQNRAQTERKHAQNQAIIDQNRRDDARQRAMVQAQADARQDAQIRAQQRQKAKAVAVAQQKHRADQIQVQKARQIQQQKAKAVAATQQKQRAAKAHVQARIEARQKAIRDRHNDNREAPNIARN